MTSGTSKVRRAYAPGPHGQIHYRRSGPDGVRSPLLLLHPCPGSGYLYDAFLAEMGRDRTVIAPDFPGFGMSDAPPGAPGIAGYAAAMLELETDLGLGVFDIMGYHAGGAVAVDMARQQPKAVRKIVMIGAPMFSDEERAAFNGRLTVHGPDERAKGIEKSWPAFKTHFWKMEADPVRTWNIYLDGQKNPEVSSWGLRAVLNYDLAASLSTLTQPALVLNPQDDLTTFTPRAAASLKNGRIVDLEWTHGMLDVKTAEVAEIVRKFLDQ